MDTSCSLKYVSIYMTLRDKFNSSGPCSKKLIIQDSDVEKVWSGHPLTPFNCWSQ